METAVLENEVEMSPHIATDERHEKYVRTTVDQSRTILELGIWLSGIEVFAAAGGRPFVGNRAEVSDADLIREFRIVRLALQRCSHSIFLLIRPEAPETLGTGNLTIATADLRQLGQAIRTELLQCESLNRLDALSIAEFRAWSNSMLTRLRLINAFSRLTAIPDAEINENLPESVTTYTSRGDLQNTEILDTMSRFGRILTVLATIGEMLDHDEPLKPGVLIFAKVHAMTLEMIDHLNRRVSRLGEGGGDLADSIDGASYTAAIELKKAVGQELNGLMQMRAATGVFARTEAAYSLLAESFQQIITVLARQIDQSADMFEMFPNFRTKLERSVALRSELYSIADLARTAEAKPEKQKNERLIEKLVEFSDVSIRYLFYKDIETFERFVEEIRVTKQSKDLVPILHRFGAYLETLFAQVNMRAVLEGHPFER